MLVSCVKIQYIYAQLNKRQKKCFRSYCTAIALVLEATVCNYNWPLHSLKSKCEM